MKHLKTIIVLLLVILLICAWKSYTKESFQGDVETVPEDSMMGRVAKLCGFRPEASISGSMMSPKDCSCVSKQYFQTNEKTQDTWELESLAQACLMRYGEFEPQYKFGVAGPHKNMDSAFLTK